MKKIIVSIIVSITILIQFIITISATDTLVPTDHGIFSGANVDGDLTYRGKDGTISFPGIRYLYPFWGLSNVQKGYTYVLTFTCKSDVNFQTDESHLGKVRYWITGQIPKNYNTLYEIPSATVTATEQANSNKYTYTYTVAFNTDLIEINSFPDILYVFCSNNCSGNGTYLNIEITDCSFTYFYDPNGDTYLKDIRDSLHVGEGYPIPDNTQLQNSVGSLSSAEGTLKDKSTEIKNSINSELTNNISTAKSLANTLKPASVQINNLYTTVLTALPTEVKAIFIAIPLLLFIGWLIGRIKE